MFAEKKRFVYFFTNEVNISFVQNEINNLSKDFTSVYVYAFKKKSDVQFAENVFIKEPDYTGYSTSTVFFKHFFTVLGLAFMELIRAPKYLRFFSDYIKAISELLRSLYLADQLKKDLKGQNSVFYTFWFNQWATVLSLLVRKDLIDSYYSRTHGADLYEYRVPKTHRIAFRWFQLKYASTVFSVSEKGAKYLEQLYPEYADKINSLYLGSKDMGLAEFDPNERFTIVSCANVRNIKRIHLIPEILQHLNFDFKWIHIGNENLNSKDATIPLYKKNKELLQQKKNAVVECVGALSNEEVLKLYKENSINLFVSVSETEGLPVSMMEAISFGIPILSTDVGGCSEIVTDKTGILIPKNFDPKEVAKSIDLFRGSEKNTAEYRKDIRKYWQIAFSEEVNFQLFMGCLSANSIVKNAICV